MATARQRLMTESYEDVERLIWDVVHKFHRRHGDLYGTLQELFSEGCVGFTIAYARYNPEKGSFPTYVRMVVSHTLLELVRSETKRRVRLNTTSDVEITDSSRQFSVAEFLDDLSEDARTIVMLVLDTPGDLLSAMQEDECSPKHLLRQYCAGMGWAAERITKCFSEISLALN